MQHEVYRCKSPPYVFFTFIQDHHSSCLSTTMSSDGLPVLYVSSPPSHTCLSITCPFSPITDLHTCPILTGGCNPHCSCYTWEKHRGYQQVWTLPTPYMGHFTIANRFESYGNYVNDVHIQASSMMTHSISLRPHTIPCPGVALIFVVSANLNYPW